MNIAKPTRIAATVVVGLLLTKFAHAQVKTDTLTLPVPRDTTTLVQKDTASAKQNTLQINSVSSQDTSKTAAQAGTGPEPKQDSLRITLDRTHVTITCMGTDGQMIKNMSINIESELAEIGVKPNMAMEIDEKHIVIKKGKIYVLFDGYERALTLRPKSGDVDSGVAPAPKK